MKGVFYVFIAIAIAISSCTKQQQGTGTSSTEKTGPARQAPVPFADEKDQEDRPILMQKVWDDKMLPLQHALVTLTKDTQTLSQYTDWSGKCQFVLPGYGYWQLDISCPGYKDLSKWVHIVDSVTARIDTLQAQ